jgi:hypothetical protein
MTGLRASVDYETIENIVELAASCDADVRVDPPTGPHSLLDPAKIAML